MTDDLFKDQPIDSTPAASKSRKRSASADHLPPNLGKAVKLPVPDFNDPNRPLTCLEVDFPIAPINALSKLEGNAGKPIYQMSKWWARRRSCVFRSMLIAAATEAPKPGETDTADKRVWDHYYANHQKAGSFKHLKVLDPFMGGGTTLVEGARLGMKMTGVDLNPVAWFVVKNELACSDPQQVAAFFKRIEEKVKPLVHPFYTTSCPRGHKGRWIDVATGAVVDVDLITLRPEDRKKYRWEGPEVIYTFWAKHGPCPAHGCGHRTPVFRSPVIAEKKLSTDWLPVSCPDCHHDFRIELGETRMAPGVERVVLPEEPCFTETTQPFAKLFADYSKGSSHEMRQRVARLLSMVDKEPGCRCPKCGTFVGGRLKTMLELHARATRIGDIKKKDFGFESGPIYMYLLMRPEWLRGSNGMDAHGKPLGGYAGADVDSTRTWYERRQQDLALVEVRGRIRLSEDDTATAAEEEADAEDAEAAGEGADEGDPNDRKKFGLPRRITLADGTVLETRKGTMPEAAAFTCSSCGGPEAIVKATEEFGRTAPVCVSTLQCHCPDCDNESFNYGGRYFKVPDAEDVRKLVTAEAEWERLRDGELRDYWPRTEISPSHMTHERQPLPQHGYTHWWKMFNSRQLLVHAQLLRAIDTIDSDGWPLDVREQALGAFQQYLRNQNMFAFWNVRADKLEPFMSNNNYHPKVTMIENSFIGDLGRGNWTSCLEGIVEGAAWASEPWEPWGRDNRTTKTVRLELQDPLPPEPPTLACGSSTDQPALKSGTIDLAITDPPFGNNLYYADLAEFFYQWLRLPLRKWYGGTPEAAHFEPDRTPHAMEAVENPHEHPDDRKPWETELFVLGEHLLTVRQLSGDEALQVGEVNPLYRREPAPDFYRRTLEACWSEAHRVLKPGGILAFTFHHKDDAPWVDVLESLFEAGYLLVATYPIRSDETKGDKAQFGARRIEYDIIHVCRKRLIDPEPVAWAKMRRFVREEATRLKKLIEGTHGSELSESDLKIILIGKALEFYSRHYGQVYTGDATILPVRDALMGINQILEDLKESETIGPRIPDGAQPLTRHYLRLFAAKDTITRDELSKSLRGTGYSPEQFTAMGWVRKVGTKIEVLPIAERFNYFTAKGRKRSVIQSDLDIAHFLIGAAMPGTKVDIEAELRQKRVIPPLATDEIIAWYETTTQDPAVHMAANTAKTLLANWRSRPRGPEATQAQLTLFERLEVGT
jgi:putative DNA methylase